MAFFTDHTILFYFLIYVRGESADAKEFLSPTGRDSSPFPAKSIVVDR